MSSEILAKMRAERDRKKAMEAERRQELLDAYGTDPCEDGDVLIWVKQFNLDGPEYNYSATKARGQWFVSGTEVHYDWLSLLDEIERDNIAPISIYLVSEVEELFVEEDEDDE